MKRAKEMQSWGFKGGVSGSGAWGRLRDGGSQGRRPQELKTQILGREPGEDREGKVLTRVIRATDPGWEYEADQRHGELIVKETGMENAKPTTTPAAEEKEELDDKEELNQEGSKWYRSVAARGN